MWPSWSSRPFHLVFAVLLFLSQFGSATRLLESESLNPCQAVSGFTATLFNVVFTPDNGTFAFDVVGVSTISGNVTAVIDVTAYGINIYHDSVDPCDVTGSVDLSGLCPLNTGQININSNIIVSQDIVKNIPSVAFTVPDLDGLVQIHINSTSGKSEACLEAQLSNGKTVYQKGVEWTIAVIAGLALVVSAVVSGLGHSNTAAHVAANALSLFGLFQAQAMIGMTAVVMPPIVQSWTQNFQWSMGIIRVGFLQDICTWYQRSTGGTPSVILTTLATTSVEVQKRSVETVHRLFLRAYDQLTKRSNNSSSSSAAATTQLVIVKGIKRVGFRAFIESTNIFLTGLIIFMVFAVAVAVSVLVFKGFCEMAVKAGWLKSDKFQDFRNGWKIILKGILFRIVLIGFPQLSVLCLWELTQRDSSAEVVLAIFFFVAITLSLAWAALKVIRIAKRSVAMHKNPAYILYSDPKALNKWGFLYVQFRATAYYFILPFLAYILLKAAFIAFGQGSGPTQAVALVIIEAVALIAVSILRPWMDKRTNWFNIAIVAVNFLNAIFLLFFSNVFNQPAVVTAIMGVVFAFYNMIFCFVLLVLVLFSMGWAILSKNPDTRYQPMRDDRGSFIKSQSQLNGELDALGATARGGMREHYKMRDLDDDDSFTSGSGGGRSQYDAAGVPLPPSTSGSTMAQSQRDGPRSPIDHSTPFMGGRQPENSRGMYNGCSDRSQSGNSVPLMSSRSRDASPTPDYSYQPHGYGQQSAAPWQRGAGYDH